MLLLHAFLHTVVLFLYRKHGKSIERPKKRCLPSYLLPLESPQAILVETPPSP